MNGEFDGNDKELEAKVSRSLKAAGLDEKNPTLRTIFRARVKKAENQHDTRAEKKAAGLRQFTSDWMPAEQVENLRSMVTFLKKLDWPAWAFCTPSLKKDKSQYQWTINETFGELPQPPNVAIDGGAGAITSDNSGDAQSSRQGRKEGA